MLLVHLQGIFHSGANEGAWPYFYLHLHDFYGINLGKYTVRPVDPYRNGAIFSGSRELFKISQGWTPRLVASAVGRAGAAGESDREIFFQQDFPVGFSEDHPGMSKRARDSPYNQWIVGCTTINADPLWEITKYKPYI